ncbi:unnamed protein product [Auanema sp. JU1783]|nr:unnamed protein product [Auanema sp. JU1783]
MEKFDVDTMLSNLMAVGMCKGRLTKAISEEELIKLTVAAKAVFMSQPILLEVDAPIVLCGDIHGQYSDLLRIFDKNGFPPEQNYMFLGDYVDRGRQNIETICLLFCLKIKYPNNFFLLRGNHESAAVNRVYGFYEEIVRRYKSVKLWQSFQDAFSWMPLCGLIAGRVFCMHGGLSPDLKSFEDVRKLERPIVPVNPSMVIDLLWSDPDANVQGWESNTRGVSYVFGEDVVQEMCKSLNIDLIVRAHQVVQDGYEFFANRKLVTVFSAPNYCGQFDNHAASMKRNSFTVCETYHWISVDEEVYLTALN